MTWTFNWGEGEAADAPGCTPRDIILAQLHLDIPFVYQGPQEKQELGYAVMVVEPLQYRFLI